MLVTAQFMKSDEQLMLEYQAGTPQAFDELFQRYRNPISRGSPRRVSMPCGRSSPAELRYAMSSLGWKGRAREPTQESKAYSPSSLQAARMRHVQVGQRLWE